MLTKEGQLDFLPASPRAILPILDERARGTRFLAINVRSALNSPAATHMGFWSLNPYIGCEFGCTYCYARDTHRWTVERMSRGAEEQKSSDPEPDAPALQLFGSSAHPSFERDILVKSNLADALVRTLNPAKLAGQTLAIGTATDPYQPAERRFRLTRQALETLMAYRGIRLGITTKSPLVVRDIDLLTKLGERHEVSVNLSIATLDPRLARRLEARSAVPAARLRAVRQLTDAGIRTGVFVMPILPCITDGRRELDALLAAAKEAGARFASWSALRLGPAARRHFLPHLAKEFPELVARYARHYARYDTAGWAYRNALRARFHALRRKHGFAED
ncbi:MAG: radical SAM protein [Gemmatimonadales bacterium]